MLIHSFYLLGALILVQSVLSSGLRKYDSNQSEETSRQLKTEPEIYRYNHPPLTDVNTDRETRKEKSIDVNEQQSTPPTRTRSRGAQRRRTLPKVNESSSLEIPVKIIYDEVTTVSPKTVLSQPSAVENTTRVFVKRRRVHSNTSKKIDVRHIKPDESDKTKVTGNVTDSNNSHITSSTMFPKRSRSSYFKKRTTAVVPTPKVKILEEKNFVYSHSGNFHYSYLSEDGTNVSSQGQLKSYDNAQTGESVSGSVVYIDNEGNDFSLSYTADENGYRPVGAHLPTPPPLPPAIARALKYIADKSTTVSPVT